MDKQKHTLISLAPISLNVNYYQFEVINRRNEYNNAVTVIWFDRQSATKYKSNIPGNPSTS